MAPLLSKNLEEEVAGAVDDLRAIGKSLLGLDISVEKNETFDAIEVSNGALDGAEGIEAGDLCGGGGLFQVKLVGKWAKLLVSSRDDAELSGNVEEAIAPLVGEVRSFWGGDNRELQAERLQAHFERAHSF